MRNGEREQEAVRNPPPLSCSQLFLLCPIRIVWLKGLGVEDKSDWLTGRWRQGQGSHQVVQRSRKEGNEEMLVNPFRGERDAIHKAECVTTAVSEQLNLHTYVTQIKLK